MSREAVERARIAATEAEAYMRMAESAIGYDPVQMASLWVGVGKLWVGVMSAEGRGGAADILRDKAAELMRQATELDLADDEAADMEMPDRCDPEEGVHVALDGERRCMCPAKMKIT